MITKKPADMSDSELDLAYDTARKSTNQVLMGQCSAEIVSRLASVSGFLRSLFSVGDRYPLYAAVTKFHNAAEAKASVAASAGNVASTIGSAVGSITAPLIALGLIAAFIVWKAKSK